MMRPYPETGLLNFKRNTAGLLRILGYVRSFLMYRSNPLRTRNMALLYSEFIRRGDLCFDIGAHIGSHVSIWLKLGARVVAVEPHPGCIKILNFLYGRNRNTVILPRAVANTGGERTLYTSRFSPTLSSMFPEWINDVRKTPGFSNSKWEESFKVETVTLDGLIQIYGEPSFCKIDVEGGELEVLQGLSVALKALSFEYISAVMGRAGACIEHLGALGNYEYNWIIKEGEPFSSRIWLGAGEMQSRLGSIATGSGSGDIYARKM